MEHLNQLDRYPPINIVFLSAHGFRPATMGCASFAARISVSPSFSNRKQTEQHFAQKWGGNVHSNHGHENLGLSSSFICIKYSRQITNSCFFLWCPSDYEAKNRHTHISTLHLSSFFPHLSPPLAHKNTHRFRKETSVNSARALSSFASWTSIGRPDFTPFI